MRALVVDDQRSARHVLVQLLTTIGDMTIDLAASLEEARRQIETSEPDIVFIDLRLGDDIRNRDGLVLLEELGARTSATPVVVSGYADVTELRAAFRLGAFDYLVKDTLCEELVRPLVESVRARRRLRAEVDELRVRLVGNTAPTGLVGSSPTMCRLRDVIRRIAVSDRTVLVTGATGTGKELVVRAIHSLGAHASAPFLDLNCGALPSGLLESQLFGHEKGSFTGAESRQVGYLTAVGDGTLFLDEIAELEASLQAKLLRVLETRTFRPVGSVSEHVFRGRVVTATHADLDEAVRAGRFREDLYFRINVLQVRLPTLDERREDIPALVGHFAARQRRRLVFDVGAMTTLLTAPWPGNVRQLRNVVDRVAALAPSERVTEHDVKAALQPEDTAQHDVARQLANVLLAVADGDKLALAQRVLVDEAMRIARDNKSAAARLLGVHRKVVERWVSRSFERTD